MNGDVLHPGPTGSANGSAGPAEERAGEDRLRRERAVTFARASVELEGFSIGAEAEQDAALFISGEIDLGEFIRRGKARAAF
ncbi:antitoxin VbhA family protein [Paraburkholderia sp. RL17-373-BIF-A]|uniref:antitoxin VbhA family protein n=1 Tax=Paraburkholderia sp. RL17-373-BIF-A TaxID=3031629 RepID=UPI0038BA9CDA